MTADSDNDRDKTIEFDVFISHAFEDKEDFVRPLAAALEEKHLRPWYDEFTLRPGDSLRRSIDHGLLTSQAGIIVLSEAFFAKRWTAYELDGLVQLHAGALDQVSGPGQGSRIIPVWHGVDVIAVQRYSPSLANLVALNSRDGVEVVVERILRLLRPAGSTLLFAQAELAELGEPHRWHPPVVTDDWWLDAAGASGRRDVDGTFQEAMGRGRWGFPLPGGGQSPRERGHRLAHAAAQMMWQNAAAERPISQVTPPEEVLDFIDEFPALADACIKYPSYFLTYAPQLALRGAAGRFQRVVDQVYREALGRFAEPERSESRLKIANRHPYLVLRDVQLVTADRGAAARHWVQGDLSRAPARVFDTIDYAGWLVSDASIWMGNRMRTELLAGIREWREWRGERIAMLLGKLKDDLSDPKALRRIRDVLAERMDRTVQVLGLHEDGDTLAGRLVPVLIERLGRTVWGGDASHS